MLLAKEEGCDLAERAMPRVGCLLRSRRLWRWLLLLLHLQRWIGHAVAQGSIPYLLGLGLGLRLCLA